MGATNALAKTKICLDRFAPAVGAREALSVPDFRRGPLRLPRRLFSRPVPRLRWVRAGARVRAAMPKNAALLAPGGTTYSISRRAAC